MVVIFHEAPDQTVSSVIGRSISQNGFAPVCAIGQNGELLKYIPKSIGNDTISFPTYNGYAEIMLQYQGIEWDYYMLKEGDTVLVEYDKRARPYIKSLLSEKNTYLYNISKDSENFHSNGYSLSTILHSDYFNAWYSYYNNKELQNKYPGLMEEIGKVYVNLDSLNLEYEDYKNRIVKQIDSLHLCGEEYYADYYKKTILNIQAVSPIEIVQDDALLHYIQFFKHSLDYPQGTSPSEKFDYMLSDTVATTFAKRIILNYYLNRIIASDDWFSFDEQTVNDYKEKYAKATGDTSFVQKTISTPNYISKKGYTFDLVLESPGGAITSLDRIMNDNSQMVFVVDLWASWCAPCIREIPYLDTLVCQYSDKGILFLCLSVDKDKNAWLMENNKMNQYSNRLDYRILNYENSKFIKEIKAGTIPQYIIIGKDAEILDINAPRPSSGKMETRLNTIWQ